MSCPVLGHKAPPTTSGGCPVMPGGRAAANGGGAALADATLARVDALLHAAFMREAAVQMDACRARVAGAGRLTKGLWALGLSHDAAPLGRGHCVPEAQASRRMGGLAQRAREAAAAECQEAGLRDRLGRCRGQQECVQEELGAFFGCASAAIQAAAQQRPAG